MPDMLWQLLNREIKCEEKDSQHNIMRITEECDSLVHQRKTIKTRKINKIHLAFEQCEIKWTKEKKKRAPNRVVVFNWMHLISVSFLSNDTKSSKYSRDEQRNKKPTVYVLMWNAFDIVSRRHITVLRCSKRTVTFDCKWMPSLAVQSIRYRIQATCTYICARIQCR